MSKSGIMIKLCIFGFLLAWFPLSYAQTQPRITLLDMVYQGPSDYYRTSPLPPPPVSEADTKNTSKKPAAPAITLRPEDLQRIGIVLKGMLLRQGAYRLVPPLKTINHNPSNLSAISKAIDDNAFPESDFIMLGIVNYVNATTVTTSDAAKRTKTSQLTLDMVGEFSLVNTATKKVDVYFTVMGTGTDTKTLNIASDTAPLNKIKIITDASNALANAASQELEIQLTPDVIQKRINDGELKVKADPNNVTIK